MKFRPFRSKTVKTAYRPHPARRHLEIASFWEKQLLNHDLHLKVSHCAKFQPITQSSSVFMAIWRFTDFAFFWVPLRPQPLWLQEKFFEVDFFEFCLLI